MLRSTPNSVFDVLRWWWDEEVVQYKPPGCHEPLNGFIEDYDNADLQVCLYPTHEDEHLSNVGYSWHGIDELVGPMRDLEDEYTRAEDYCMCFIKSLQDEDWLEEAVDRLVRYGMFLDYDRIAPVIARIIKTTRYKDATSRLIDSLADYDVPLTEDLISAIEGELSQGDCSWRFLGAVFCLMRAKGSDYEALAADWEARGLLAGRALVDKYALALGAASGLVDERNRLIVRAITRLEKEDAR